MAEETQTLGRVQNSPGAISTLMAQHVRCKLPLWAQTASILPRQCCGRQRAGCLLPIPLGVLRVQLKAEQGDFALLLLCQGHRRALHLWWYIPRGMKAQWAQIIPLDTALKE